MSESRKLPSNGSPYVAGAEVSVGVQPLFYVSEDLLNGVHADVLRRVAFSALAAGLDRREAIAIIDAVYHRDAAL